MFTIILLSVLLVSLFLVWRLWPEPKTHKPIADTFERDYFRDRQADYFRQNFSDRR